MWGKRLTDIGMTDMVELIQGLKDQLKGTGENNTEGGKDDGNSEKLVKGELQAGAADKQEREWKGASRHAVGNFTCACWLQLSMSYVDWRKIHLQKIIIVTIIINNKQQ